MARMMSVLWITCLFLVWNSSHLPVSAGLMTQTGSGLETSNTARLKLRAGPGLEWAILGYVEIGDTLSLNGRAPYETLWVRGTTSDGRSGWMIGLYFTATPAQLSALPVVSSNDPLPSPPPVAAARTPQPNTAPPAGSSVISGITDNARAIFLRGQEQGNRANVFSKVGDSITASRYFLFPIGWGLHNLRDYTNLQSIITYYSAASARDGNNSFANPSLAAYDGLTTRGVLDASNAWSQVCEPGETPLECEYRLVRPAVALIMLGTNDVALLSPADYRAYLERVVQISLDQGVVPLLSLLPVRAGYESQVVAFNQIITETARNYQIPLWHFPSALAGLENNGLSDGIHPSAPDGGTGSFATAADFSADNLRYGYTVRNLSALQALDTLRRTVLY